MSAILTFRRVFIDTSLWLSIGSIGILLASSFAIISHTPHLLTEIACIWFFAVLFVYNYNKFTDKEEDKVNSPEREEYISTYGKIFLLLGVVGYTFFLLRLYFHVGNKVFVFLFPLLIAFLYSSLRLKRIFLLKDFLVPLGWSCIPLSIIVIFSKYFWEAILFWFFIFSRSFTITLFYDTKDVEGDRIAGVKTPAVVFGVQSVIKFLIFFNISLLAFFFFLFFTIQNDALFFFPIPVITFSLVYLLISLSGIYSLKNMAEILSAGEYVLLLLLSIIYYLWVS
jgi:4-hydroxybenzoate polyprenyltransferase